MLTGAFKADWIQLPVERYLAVFPTLKQGVIAGAQVREEERVISVQFLGSQQDVSTCKIKKKQVDDATAIA